MSLGVRRSLQGVAFLLVLVVMLGLTVAKFQRRFESSVPVTLRVARAGSQLEKDADVKLRGIVVGRVASKSANAGIAVLRLALQPDKVRLIPADVRARILPKTLFGEKYIDLVMPEGGGSAARIKRGDVIDQDRSTPALEIEQVLGELFPLLRSLEPEKLNATLTAIADGLRHRGDALGQSLANLDRYLAGIEPELPTIQADLSGLADLAESLGDNADDLLALARNAAASSRTLTAKSDVLAQFLRGTAGFTGTLTAILQRDGDRLIRVSETSRPILELVHARRGVIPPTVRGLEKLLISLNSALDHGPNGERCDLPAEPANPFICALDIRLEITPNRGFYTAPCAYPTCGEESAAPGVAPPPTTTGSVGSPAEKQLLADLLGPVLQIPGDEVPDVAGLLFGPILRGAEVRLR